VTYFASEFEARLVEASMLPSERGNDSLLADVLKDAMGNVIGPSAEQSGNATADSTIALHNAGSNTKHDPFFSM
jgi:hypothetical protein